MTTLAAKMTGVALGQTTFSGMYRVLECVASELNAEACILWRAMDEESAEERSARLMVLAEWCCSGACSIYDLRPDSITGRALEQGKPVYVPDVDENPPGLYRTRFLERNEIKSLVTVPIVFGQEFRGALNVYRRTRDGFDDASIRVIEETAPLVLALYRLLVAQVSTSFLDEMEQTLQRIQPSSPFDAHEMRRHVGSAVCGIVAKYFRCLGCNVRWNDPPDVGIGRWSDVDVLEPPVTLLGLPFVSGRCSDDLRRGQVEPKVISRLEAEIQRFREASKDSAAPGTLARLEGTEKVPLGYVSVPMTDDNGPIGGIECFVATDEVTAEHSILVRSFEKNPTESTP